MKKITIVIDMQNDFLTGTLANPDAVSIIPSVLNQIKNADYVMYTRDTHEENIYFETQEGKNLPVEHCIKDTDGWQIQSELDALRKEEAIDKPTFGSVALGQLLKAYDTYEEKRLTSCYFRAFRCRQRHHLQGISQNPR